MRYQLIVAGHRLNLDEESPEQFREVKAEFDDESEAIEACKREDNACVKDQQNGRIWKPDGGWSE